MTVPMIELKAAFFALVENGSKRSTIRAGAKFNGMASRRLLS